jgi:hypothetical protein
MSSRANGEQSRLTLLVRAQVNLGEGLNKDAPTLSMWSTLAPSFPRSGIDCALRAAKNGFPLSRE